MLKMLWQGRVCKPLFLFQILRFYLPYQNSGISHVSRGSMPRPGGARRANKKNSSANLFNPLEAKLKIANDKLEAPEATVAELRAARSPYDVIVQTAVEVCI